MEFIRATEATITVDTRAKQASLYRADFPGRDDLSMRSERLQNVLAAILGAAISRLTVS